MFSQSTEDCSKILEKYVAKIPEPLNRQFADRLSKPEAISHKDERNRLTTKLFPAGNITNIFVNHGAAMYHTLFTCVKPECLTG